MTDIREVVVDALLEIERSGGTSGEIINNTLTKYGYLTKHERSFISRTIRGTMENEIKYDHIIGSFSKLPVSKMKPLIRILLRMSVYQLYEMNNIPESAVCNEAVKLAKKRGFKNLSGFVNGILRNIIREKDKVVFPDKNKDFRKFLSVSYSLPDWLISYWLKFLDEETVEKMAKAMLEPEGCLTLNINPKVISTEDLISMMKEAGITAEAGVYNKNAVRIRDYDSIRSLPYFDKGAYFVQDESSMLAVRAAGIKEGDIIIDVCAAPGGKSMAAAIKAGNDGRVYSRDISEKKINRIHENVSRMNIKNIDISMQDATKLNNADIEKADIVIADLPCSGLGVIGRKPDIKKNMSMQGIKDLAALQRQILSVVQRYVKKGGTLAFSTCTVSYLENEENAKWFADTFPFDPVSLEGVIPEGISDTLNKGYYSLIQGKHRCDGGFAAVFVRREDS